MKLLLTLVFCVCFIYAEAQNCSSIVLMKKGTQLEYMAYNPRKKNKEMLRLIFEVTEVIDSSGSTYSTISKRGFGIRDEERDHYEKTIRLQCDGKNLLLPFDFYNLDTTWINDVWSGVITKTHLFATGLSPLKEGNNYIIPLNPEGVSSLPTEPKQVKQIMTRTGAPSNAPGWHKLKGSTFWYKDYGLTFDLKEIKVTDKQQVTVPAGTFECYIIIINCDLEQDEMSLGGVYTMYYNTEVGVVKIELDGYNGKKKISSAAPFVLKSIKK
jgi:hypothetical protein